MQGLGAVIWLCAASAPYVWLHHCWRASPGAQHPECQFYFEGPCAVVGGEAGQPACSRKPNAYESNPLPHTLCLNSICETHVCKTSAGFWNAMIYNISTKKKNVSRKKTFARYLCLQRKCARTNKHTRIFGHTMYGGKLWSKPISMENPSVASSVELFLSLAATSLMKSQ